MLLCVRAAMKKFLAESAVANLALIAFLFAYVYVEQAYGAQGKWTLVAVGIVGFGFYAYRRWRMVRLQQSDPHTRPGP